MGFFGITKKVEDREVEHQSVHTVISKLKTLFENSIGKKNGKTMAEIYREIYGETTDNQYVRMYRISILLGAISALKKNSNYFIISSKNNTERVWFIVKDYQEAGEYCSDIDRKIVGLKFMKEKCIKAVDEKLYLQLNQKIKRIEKKE